MTHKKPTLFAAFVKKYDARPSVFLGVFSTAENAQNAIMKAFSSTHSNWYEFYRHMDYMKIWKDSLQDYDIIETTLDIEEYI